jgi:hypothetical protein
LPKPTEQAISAGSTFVLKVPEELNKKLLELENGGIGHRRREGFGQIEIDPPTWEPPIDSGKQPRPVPVDKPKTEDETESFAIVQERVKELLQRIGQEGDGTAGEAAVNQVRTILRDVAQGVVVLEAKAPAKMDFATRLRDLPYWRKRTAPAIKALIALIAALRAAGNEGSGASAQLAARAGLRKLDAQRRGSAARTGGEDK